MRIRTLFVPTIFLILFGNITAEVLFDPRPFVTQKEISESYLNDAAHRVTDLGTYSSPVNMLINVGIIIQNGTLEEADLNSTLSADNQKDVIAVRNMHVIYPNRPTRNSILQFDFCELQPWTSASARLQLSADLSRQLGAVMTSTYFVSKFATFSQDIWMELEPDFIFAKFNIVLEDKRPADARNIGIELIFELVATDPNGPSISEFIKSISLTDSCDGDVSRKNVEVDKEDPLQGRTSYKLINSIHWIIWFTPSQRRLFSDRSVAFRAVVQIYEDNTIWCEPGSLYCESTVVSTNSTSSIKAVQIALGLSIGIGATAACCLGVALFITVKRLKVLQTQIWGESVLDYRELRDENVNLPTEDSY